MNVFACPVCSASLCAEDHQVGQLVKCPTCATTLRVPGAAGEPAAVTRHAEPRFPGGSTRSGGRRYGFNCPYCSSRLEANEATAAQDGQCPTCGNEITIPILDRHGRLIDPRTREVIKQDPHPVHAYAAAGERGPVVVRTDDGTQMIRCPRCQTLSPVSANNCGSCTMPFTMEGTTLEAAGVSNGFCVASLVLGIIGIPANMTLIPPVLAVIFGILGYNQVSHRESAGGGKGMAIAGAICGALGCLLAVVYYGGRV